MTPWSMMKAMIRISAPHDGLTSGSVYSRMGCSARCATLFAATLFGTHRMLRWPGISHASFEVRIPGVGAFR